MPFAGSFVFTGDAVGGRGRRAWCSVSRVLLFDEIAAAYSLDFRREYFPARWFIAFQVSQSRVIHEAPCEICLE